MVIRVKQDGRISCDLTTTGKHGRKDIEPMTVITKSDLVSCPQPRKESQFDLMSLQFTFYYFTFRCWLRNYLLIIEVEDGLDVYA